MRTTTSLALALGLAISPCLRSNSAGTAYANYAPVAADRIQDGDSAPALHGVTPGGQEVEWNQFSGRAVILYFHSPRTRNASRSLRQLADLLKDSASIRGRCTVVLVVDDAETGVAAKSELDRSGVDIKVCIDAKRATGSAYGVLAFPTAFIVDGKAQVVGSTRGYGTFFSFHCVTGCRYALGLIAREEFDGLNSGSSQGWKKSSKTNSKNVLMVRKLIDAGKWEIALPLAQKAAAKGKADPSLLVLLVHLELKAEHPAEATGWLDRLIGEYPESYSDAPLRARIAILGRDFEGARKLLEAEKSRSVEALHAKGLLLEAEGQQGAALELYREALEQAMYNFK